MRTVQRCRFTLLSLLLFPFLAAPLVHAGLKEEAPRGPASAVTAPRLGFDPSADADENEPEQTPATNPEKETEAVPVPVREGSGYTIDINLSEWRLRVLQGGRVVEGLVSPISYGTSKHPTPTGNFGITYMDADAYSGRYNAQMPYAIFFISTLYAMHAGNINGRSHGCVRLPYSFAKRLYGFVSGAGRRNFRVSIHY